MPEGEQGGAGKEGCCDTATYTTGGKRELRDKPEGEQGGASKEGRARRDEQGEASKEGCCDTATYTTGTERPTEQSWEEKPLEERREAGVSTTPASHLTIFYIIQFPDMSISCLP